MPKKQRPGYRLRGEMRSEAVENGVVGPSDLHAIDIEDDGRAIKVSLEGLGGGAKDATVSESRDVRLYFREIKQMRERTAYRNRPIKSELAAKAKAVERRIAAAEQPPDDDGGRPMVACPDCKRGVGMSVCGLCDGIGWVTQRNAEEWIDTHDGPDRS